MENPTSFDLNRTILRWRESLAQSPAFRRENLDELETHLRDSVAALETRGLSTEESFLVAAKRIGGVKTLAAEFHKVNPQSVWLDRILWMLIGIQVWGCVVGFTNSASSGVLSLGLVGSSFDFANHGQVLPTVLYTFIRLLGLVASFAFCWWLVVRKGESFGTRINGILNRPGALALFGGAVCLLLLLTSGLGASWWLLLLKFADMKTVGQLSSSMQYANFLGWLAQTVTLLVLTLALARKRLRRSKA